MATYHYNNLYLASRTRPLYRAVQIIWYLVGILETILAFRFLLRLFAANPGATFTQLIYNISFPFVQPFQAVFGITRVEGNVFEWTTLLAMAVYWLLAWALTRLFAMGRPVSTVEADEHLRENDR